MNDCSGIIDDINRSGADAIFIAMGCPRQELFIIKYKDILKPKIFMGVGGSFDIIAGKLKRAPAWMIKAGLEWLYRVSKEPTRILRLTSIPVFLLKVIFKNKKYA
jgi:N-acetylglucosaminyldiphosphoundecaprenol N-acetyl-beta-D-mannosaminyltransferase